uniref:Trichoplein keratin filament-binding protein n=1 Tax=Laticauda laticaudata TaxID=8630 RepID=A0A8C5SZG1_LATLA
MDRGLLRCPASASPAALAGRPAGRKGGSLGRERRHRRAPCEGGGLAPRRSRDRRVRAAWLPRVRLQPPRGRCLERRCPLQPSPFPQRPARGEQKRTFPPRFPRSRSRLYRYQSFGKRWTHLNQSIHGQGSTRKPPAVAEDRLYDCWRKSSAKLREVSSELHKKQVVEAWGDQLALKQQREAADQEERVRSENQYKRARRAALERLEQEQQRRKQEEEKQAEILRQQMAELQLRDVEATKLKEEEESLLKQHWELQALEAERKLKDEQQKKVELGRFLKHQVQAQLRKRVQQVQEELEKDRQILLALSEKDEQDQRLQSSRREEAMAAVAWMKKVIEEQLQLEREREAELETIFREEARQVWEKREEEWGREQKARDRLMAEVLAEREQQIQQKMEQNRQAQQESVRFREQLIQQLEEARQLTQWEQQAGVERKTACKQELQAQLTQRQQQQQEELQHQQEAATEAQLREEQLQELEQVEARRMVEACYRKQVGAAAQMALKGAPLRMAGLRTAIPGWRPSGGGGERERSDPTAGIRPDSCKASSACPPSSATATPKLPGAKEDSAFWV